MSKGTFYAQNTVTIATNIKNPTSHQVMNSIVLYFSVDYLRNCFFRIFKEFLLAMLTKCHCRPKPMVAMALAIENTFIFCSNGS